ncbi:MAG TPA: hypothetical protein VMW91_11085 [Desulfosporosinus sp.]|nr:hypothetical protein [Desulfosporosinus sp.]
MSSFKQRMDEARGFVKIDLVLRNARLVNVFSGEIHETDIEIHQGYFVGIGKFEELFVGWQWGYANVKREMSNEGQLTNDGLVRVYMVLIRYVVPIAIALVLLAGLDIIRFK